MVDAVESSVHDDFLFSNTDYLISDPAVVRASLQEMVAERSILTVMLLPATETSYNSVMLKVDAQKNVFVLDEFVPGELNRQNLAGKTLRILGRARGLVTAFDAKFNTTLRDQALISHTLHIPPAVYQLQRREHFRVPPSVHEPIHVHMRIGEGAPRVGNLFDISLGGLGIFMPHDVVVHVRRGDVLRACEFSLPQEGIYKVDLEVRSLTTMRSARTGQSAIRLGGAFLGLDSAARTSIMRYVSKRDREILRQVRLG